MKALFIAALIPVLLLLAVQFEYVQVPRSFSASQYVCDYICDKCAKTKSTTTKTSSARAKDNKRYFFCPEGPNSTLPLAHFVLSYMEGWKKAKSISSQRLHLLYQWPPEPPSTKLQEKICSGKLIFNHMEGEDYFSSKTSLVDLLKKLERTRPSFQLSRVMPPTYNLDNERDCKQFFADLKENETLRSLRWLTKFSNQERGEGVRFHNSTVELEEEYENGALCGKKKSEFVVQKYIERPLLIEGRKVDFRVYVLVEGSDPVRMYFHPGFARSSVVAYNSTSGYREVHLTNTAESEKYLGEGADLESTTLSWEDVQHSLFENRLTSSTYLNDVILERMKRTMSFVAAAVEPLLKKKCVGSFSLLGCDFVVDSNYKPWFLECNRNPALNIKTNVKREVIPRMLATAFNQQWDRVFGKDIPRIEANEKWSLVYEGYKVVKQKAARKGTA